MTKKATKAATIETRGKDTHYFQFQQTQAAFFSQPQTMKQVACTTGIDRSNICRYVASLRKESTIWLIRKGICPITRHPGVGFYSTNPKFVENQPQQLNLFEP